MKNSLKPYKIGLVIFLSLFVLFSVTFIVSSATNAQGVRSVDQPLPPNFQAFSFCGDGICAFDESFAICPSDCGGTLGPYCGNGICDFNFGENGINCSVDCNFGGATPSLTQTTTCGDRICQPERGETQTNCPSDCSSGGTCGDNICNAAVGETFQSCPADCQNITSCGNMTCDTGETFQTCPTDCTAPDRCGDAICTISEKNNATCPADCQPTATPTTTSGCGDGFCSSREQTSGSCPQDCGGTPIVTSTPTPTPTLTQTPLPTATPTQIPTFTPIPTSPIECGDGICSARESTNGTCPQDCGGTPTPTVPPTSTPTALPGTTQLSLTLELPGIGSPQCQASSTNTFDTLGNNCKVGNSTRSTMVEVYNAQDQKVAEAPASVIFNGDKYTGTVNLNLNTGSYSVLVRMNNTLKKRLPGIQNITTGVTNTAPSAQLSSGDLDQNNFLDLFDWTIFIDCFANPNCSQRTLADLNDDGSIEERDVNILLRGFAIRDGDDIIGGGNTTNPGVSSTPAPTSSNISCVRDTGCPAGEICQNNICIKNQILPSPTPTISGSINTPSPTSSTITTCTTCNADVNGDGIVDTVDIATIDNCAATGSISVRCARADVNRDGVINQSDSTCAQTKLSQTCSATPTPTTGGIR